MPKELEDGNDEITEIPAPKASDFLKIDLSKARKELKELKARYEGLDPDEYAQLKAEKEERDQRDAESKGNYEKLIGAERKKAEEAQAKYRAAMDKAYEAAVDAALVSAFAANGGKPEHLDNFKVLAKSKLTRDSEGQYVVPETYLGEDGEPIAEFGDFVSIARDKGGLGFAFDPINKAQGSGDTGGKPSPANTTRHVSPAEAGKYLTEIASGEVQVRG